MGIKNASVSLTYLQEEQQLEDLLSNNINVNNTIKASWGPSNQR